MLTTRMLHSAILLRNGKVLIVGGVSQELKWVVRAELFDPETCTSNDTTGATKIGTSRTTVTALHSGDVLVVGARKLDQMGAAELYEPGKDIFTSSAPKIT